VWISYAHQVECSGADLVAAAQIGAIVGDFTAVPTSTADNIVVPKGYSAQPMMPWGDPIVPGGLALKNHASNTAEDQESRLSHGPRWHPLPPAGVQLRLI
jgi:secreted PhoX family phosphatase